MRKLAYVSLDVLTNKQIISYMYIAIHTSYYFNCCNQVKGQLKLRVTS